LTGLNRKAFEELKPTFAEVLANTEVPRRSPSPRQRATGAGRKPTLATVEAKLFFILFYFKVYPTFDLAGLLFDLDRSQANRWMHRLQPLVEEALGQDMALPKRKLTSLEAFVDAFPEVERVILDGTERAIQRAKDRDPQKEDYSGKKKRHTRTHLAAVAPDRSILVFSTAYPRKTHDKGLLNTEGWAEWIPMTSRFKVTWGFRDCKTSMSMWRFRIKSPREVNLAMSRKPRIKPSPENGWWVSMPLRA
jgi:hypothetical protein